MKNRIPVALLAALLAAVTLPARAAPRGPLAPARPVAPAGPPVVVVSIDALHPSFVLEADRLGYSVPNLRRLAREGAYARAVTGVLPTVTYASHTTLVTGVAPARHGIFYNGPFDPLERNQGGWYWYAEDIRVPTLWDVATEAGLVVSNVDWPVSVGARIRHNIVQYWRTDVPDAADDRKLSRLLSTPGLLAEAERDLGPYPSGYAYDVPADRRRAAFSAWVLEKRRARLHFAYFSGLDEEQHLTFPGHPKAMQALEDIDALVGQVRAAAERAGNGRAIFAVVSDHGHVRATREFRLNEALRAAGLILLNERGKPTGWKARAWGSGGAAAVMLAEAADDATRRAVREVLERYARGNDAPIQAILEGDAVRAAGGFPDAAFVVGVKADTVIGTRLEDPVLSPILPKGSHGHLPANAEVDASFFIAGPGIPGGRDLGRVDMRDIAPTLAGLLGLRLPKAEGHDLLAPAGGQAPTKATASTSTAKP